MGEVGMSGTIETGRFLLKCDRLRRSREAKKELQRLHACRMPNAFFGRRPISFFGIIRAATLHRLVLGSLRVLVDEEARLH